MYIKYQLEYSLIENFVSMQMWLSMITYVSTQVSPCMLQLVYISGC